MVIKIVILKHNIHRQREHNQQKDKIPQPALKHNNLAPTLLQPKIHGPTKTKKPRHYPLPQKLSSPIPIKAQTTNQCVNFDVECQCHESGELCGRDRKGHQAY
jgi:hypothetical protein